VSEVNNQCLPCCPCLFSILFLHNLPHLQTSAGCCCSVTYSVHLLLLCPFADSGVVPGARVQQRLHLLEQLVAFIQLQQILHGPLPTSTTDLPPSSPIEAGGTSNAQTAVGRPAAAGVTASENAALQASGAAAPTTAAAAAAHAATMSSTNGADGSGTSVPPEVAISRCIRAIAEAVHVPIGVVSAGASGQPQQGAPVLKAAVEAVSQLVATQLPPGSLQPVLGGSPPLNDQQVRLEPHQQCLHKNKPQPCSTPCQTDPPHPTTSSFHCIF
jgi:hypothetical protein